MNRLLVGKRSYGRATALRLLALPILAVILAGTAAAQSGKLSGRITDSANGDGLPGASVLLEGTQLGRSADAQGRYDIIGITPGTYAVRVSFIGYNTQVVTLRVTSDITTSLDVALVSSTIQGGEIQVLAERPVVDPNQTTSRSLVTGEEIGRLPVGNLQDVISRTSNSYDGFIRGSRRYETRTIIDGVDVSDALNQIAPNTNGGSVAYAGQLYNNTNRSDQTNSALFTINPEGVEEVTVNSGATEARYGAASGGVVAVTLAEGRGPIRGSGSFRMTPGMSRPGPDSLAFYSAEDIAAYNTARDLRIANNDASAALFTWTPDKYASGDPEIDARINVGGSITERLRFFAAGQWFKGSGYQPNQSSQRINGQLKGTYELGRNTRISLLGIAEDRGLWGGWNNTSYNDVFRFYLEGITQNDGGSYLGSAKVTQILSPSSFIDVQAYRTYSRSRYGYVDDNGNGRTDVGEQGDFIDFTDPMQIARYIGTGTDRSRMFYENISDSFANTGLVSPGSTPFKAGLPQPYSEDATQATMGFKVDYNNQVTPNHYLQVGTELKLYDLDYEQVYGIDQSGSKLNGALEPYVYQNWNRKPSNLGLYASDRMEYGGLIVNMGMRVEFANRDMDKINDYFYPFRRDTVAAADAGIVYQADANGVVTPALDANGAQIPRVLLRNNFDRGDAVATDVFLNPSIGVSHPIGTTAAMYFSYARSQQLLPFTTLYQMYDGNSSNNRFFTYQDPEQDPITSNNYELGVQWEFAPGWGVDVNTYMRALDNYGQANLQATNRNPTGEPALVGATHTYSTSAGYGEARGIEMTLRRAPLKFGNDITLGLTGSYTYGTIEASSFAGANQTQFQDPNPNTPESVRTLPFGNAQNFSNFLQRVRGGASTLTGGYGRAHRFVVRSVASLPYDVSVGFSGNLESGFLYNDINADARARDLLTGPTNFNIDLRLEKRFSFAQRFGLDVYVDILNLTNAQNIVAYESFSQRGPQIFQETGSPGTRLINPDGTSIYGPARAIFFGTRARF